MLPFVYITHQWIARRASSWKIYTHSQCVYLGKYTSFDIEADRTKIAKNVRHKPKIHTRLINGTNSNVHFIHQLKLTNIVHCEEQIIFHSV